jgi:hypothetical protein
MTTDRRIMRRNLIDSYSKYELREIDLDEANALGLVNPQEYGHMKLRFKKRRF